MVQSTQESRVVQEPLFHSLSRKLHLKILKAQERNLGRHGNLLPRNNILKKKFKLQYLSCNRKVVLIRKVAIKRSNKISLQIKP